MHEHRERLIEEFTKKYQAKKLIYLEDFPDPASAIRWEKQLKGGAAGEEGGVDWEVESALV